MGGDAATHRESELNRPKGGLAPLSLARIGRPRHTRIDIPLERRENGNDVSVLFRIRLGPCEYIIGADPAMEGADEGEELEFSHRQRSTLYGKFVGEGLLSIPIFGRVLSETM